MANFLKKILSRSLESKWVNLSLGYKTDRGPKKRIKFEPVGSRRGLGVVSIDRASMSYSCEKIRFFSISARKGSKIEFENHHILPIST